MTKVSTKRQGLDARVAALETQLRDLTTELRTHRVVVTDDRNRPVVVLEARDKSGVATVYSTNAEVRIDAGSQGQPVVDVLSGLGADGIGIHLYADQRDDAAGIASSVGGDVVVDNCLSKTAPRT